MPKEDCLLKVSHLSVRVESKEILHDVNLRIKQGETHVLMGPNGTGKSTLGYALMGSPLYRVTGGQILFQGQDLTGATVNERAKAGLFLSFQSPVEVPGITLFSFLRTAMEQQTGEKRSLWDYKKLLEKNMALLDMDASYAQRDLGVGFSGGEKKKAEILQLLMLQPKLAILDETDSGLDVDAVRVVSKGIEAYRAACGGSLLVITHAARLLEALAVDQTHIMVDGTILKTGDASLVKEINQNGFAAYETAGAEPDRARGRERHG